MKVPNKVKYLDKNKGGEKNAQICRWSFFCLFPLRLCSQANYLNTFYLDESQHNITQQVLKENMIIRKNKN